MKKLAFVLIVLSVFVYGCESASKPKHLLTENDMVNVLYDISILQAIKSYQPEALDSSKVDAKNYIYKKYSIDSTILGQNQEYYAQNLEQYESIQKKLGAKLKKEKEKFAPKKAEKDTKKKSEVRLKANIKRDSLRKVVADTPSHQQNEKKGQ
ncbi:hypothetical protein D3C87_330370 [compost metagenome]